MCRRINPLFNIRRHNGESESNSSCDGARLTGRLLVGLCGRRLAAGRVFENDVGRLRFILN